MFGRAILLSFRQCGLLRAIIDVVSFLIFNFFCLLKQTSLIALISLKLQY